jgi:predicted transglutaminase-like cysteine proteinase
MRLFRTKKVRPYPLTLLLMAGLATIISGLSSAEMRPATNPLLYQIEQQHGGYARKRVIIWEQLIKHNKNVDDRKKLQLVNNFFNKMTFANDIDHWGKEDYWATPLQMLTSNGGDCEDYSIAKYFTLRKMGIPAERMRLTYVKALELNQAHMVLSYYPTPDAEPLVLDNLVNDIKTVSNRQDLLPVYSFNGTDLWLSKKSGSDQHIGQSDQLSRWQSVIARINDEESHLFH